MVLFYRTANARPPDFTLLRSDRFNRWHNEQLALAGVLHASHSSNVDCLLCLYVDPRRDGSKSIGHRWHPSHEIFREGTQD